MRKFFIVISVTLMTTLGAASSVQALDWYLALNFSIADPSAPNGALQSRLVLGVDPAADNQFNNQWDTIALPAGPLQATFPHPEYLNSPDYIAGSEWLWQDIRSSSQSSHIWNLDIFSDRLGTNTTVSWTFDTAGNLCQHPSIRLIDATRGITTEISGNGSYTFPNGANPTRLVVDFTQGVAAPPPAPPMNLWSPRQGRDNILLSWSSQRDPNLLGYNLFRRTASQPNYTQVNARPISSMSFLDPNLAPGETYFYRMAAVNADGCSSGYSNEISVALN